MKNKNTKNNKLEPLLYMTFVGLIVGCLACGTQSCNTAKLHKKSNPPKFGLDVKLSSLAAQQTLQLFQRAK